MTGGSGTIRGFPSSIRVSLFSSCMLSRVRALASPLSSCLRWRSLSRLSNRARNSSMSTWVYQTSRLPSPDSVRMTCR